MNHEQKKAINRYVCGMHDFIKNVVDRLEATFLPNQKTSVWDLILSDLRASRGTSFDADYCDCIEAIIEELIKGLSDDEVIDLWNETETGLADPFDPQEDDTDCTRRHLEPEMLEAVGRYAAQECLEG